MDCPQGTDINTYKTQQPNDANPKRQLQILVMSDGIYELAGGEATHARAVGFAKESRDCVVKMIFVQIRPSVDSPRPVIRVLYCHAIGMLDFGPWAYDKGSHKYRHNK